MLVVDDEPLVRWSIAETLRGHGFDIVEACDARSAMLAASGPASLPDVVLLDLKLPDSDDLGLLMAIRRLLPCSAVILMTAFGTPELLDDARRLGACAVLDKPFDLDDLEAVIDRAVGAVKPN